MSCFDLRWSLPFKLFPWYIPVAYGWRHQTPGRTWWSITADIKDRAIGEGGQRNSHVYVNDPLKGSQTSELHHSSIVSFLNGQIKPPDRIFPILFLLGILATHCSWAWSDENATTTGYTPPAFSHDALKALLSLFFACPCRIVFS